MICSSFLFFFFFFNDTATTEIYTLSLHDALPILEHVLHEVVDADGDAAGGHHDVGGARRVLEAGAQRVAHVGDDAEIDHLAAALLDRAAQREAVGVVDLPGTARRARLGDLVARREQGHARPPAHRDLPGAERGQQADLLRSQHAARLDDDLAHPDVLAREPHVGALVDGSDPDTVALALHDFLRIHGVGAGGRRRPRHDAQRLRGAELALEDEAPGEVADHDEVTGAPGRAGPPA